MARVLVIEDEDAIRRGLCDVLVFRGHEVTAAADGDHGLALARTGQFDLCIVDVMLPGVDGFTITREVRALHGQQAILLLTARGAESDVLEGFAAGADDYVPKPFSLAQLLARIDALLRRAVPTARAAFQVGPLTIDPDRLLATRGAASVELTPRDVEVLAHFATRPGVVVTREELLTEVWGYQRVERVETRCVDMQVSKLRRRLAELGGDDVVQTVRGAGYRVDG